MADYEIINSESISTSEVVNLIEEKAKSDELTYREEKTLEHLKKVSQIDFQNTQKLIEEITALEIPRLGNEQIIKIIEIMPKSGTELRAIVSNTGIVLVDDNAKKILDTISKYK